MIRKKKIESKAILDGSQIEGINTNRKLNYVFYQRINLGRKAR